MKTATKLFATFAIFAFALFGFNLTPVQASSRDFVIVDCTMTVNNTTAQELYDFVSDLNNDHFWYPGIISTTLISGNGGSGSLYLQTADLGAGAFDNNIYVKVARDGKRVVLEGTGDFITYTANYRFKDKNNGKAEFRNFSKVSGPGLTQDALNQYETFSLSNLMNHLGKTGNIECKR